MGLKNKGKFTVVLDNKTGKYVITYIEKGVMTSLSQYSFAKTEEAEQFIKDHKEELDEVVTNFKEEEEKKKKEEEENRARKETKRKSFWAGFRKFIAGFLAAVITLVGGHFIAKKISSSMNRDEVQTEDVVSTPDEKAPEQSVENSHDQGITNIIEKEEAYTVENFTTLVAEFSKKYTDNNVDVTTEDLTKFVSVINIDKLVEENPEFAKELFSTQTKEEFLNDAAKVIGMTYTYNYQIYQKEGNTENFIKVSDSIQDEEQKNAMKVVEDYVNKIALVKDNAEEANKLIAELLQKLGDPTSELSYLDNGVGFGMQVYIELIRSCIAKDVINQENLDWLTVLTSSEEYVSNIFTIYDGCNNSYKRTKSK